MTDEQIDGIWNSLPAIKIHNEAHSKGQDTQVALRRAFARALLATLAPLSDEPVAPTDDALSRANADWRNLYEMVYGHECSFKSFMATVDDLVAPPATPSDKQEAVALSVEQEPGQISKMIERLRDRAESDEIAASEIDPMHYTPDEPESIAAGLEFLASERRECADMLEHLAAVVADQGHRMASYVVELEALAPPAKSAESGKEEAKPVAIPVPTVIDRSHPNQAYVTYGFRDEAMCTEFINATNSHTKPLYAAPRPAAQDDARDAERWRYALKYWLNPIDLKNLDALIEKDKGASK